MITHSKSVPEALVNQSGTIEESPAPAKKQTIAAKPKAARPTKTSNAPKRAPGSSRATFEAEKLVCRYCGSDDLAPSFKKRRDARCRVCFKKRYGSVTGDKKTTRTRKAKMAR